jgi:hypothetical protein
MVSSVSVHYKPDDDFLGGQAIIDCAEAKDFGVIRMGALSLIVNTSEDAYNLLNEVEALAHKMREKGL